MDVEEALRRAKKELKKARRNLEFGWTNGVPDGDMKALQEKVAYRELVVSML